ncbi:MAG: hypothetical protein FJ009_06945 [Chloroflexi bacterium]|nr:hypothetical protein [Chloroflexota bacterium]
MKKVLFALIVVAALVLVAMPVAAQGPFPYNPSANWFNRTAQMDAKWAGDPFGGNPRLAVQVEYLPDGKGGVRAVFNQGPGAVWPYTGIVAKFGLQPFGPDQILPGGIPSSMSGDGANPRKAIYIGGAWADPSGVNPVCSFVWDQNGDDANFYKCRRPYEHPMELPACATVKIPAGSSKWFKLDTWWKSNDGSKIRTQIWLDDELDGATKPSGSAVFGAANKYYWGTAPMDGWSANVFWGANANDINEVNGYFMMVYDPDVLQPNFAFAPPNAALFTVDYSGAGSLRRSCTSAAYAGQPCVPASKGGASTPAGVSLTGMLGAQNKINGATFNRFQPSHLLWTEGGYDGWVFVRVWNQMLWDGTVSVCSYRQVSP